MTGSSRRTACSCLRRRSAPADVFTAVAAEVAFLLDSDLALIGRDEPDETFIYLASGRPHAEA